MRREQRKAYRRKTDEKSKTKRENKVRKEENNQKKHEEVIKAERTEGERSV